MLVPDDWSRGFITTVESVQQRGIVSKHTYCYFPSEFLMQELLRVATVNKAKDKIK